jgi:hypothetical protein
VAQGVDPEFKTQYQKKKKLTEIQEENRKPTSRMEDNTSLIRLRG